MRRVVAVGVGCWLLVDVLRVWAPSLITIFGQAASTPAELMGAFALACVAAGLLPVLAVRTLGVPALSSCRGALLVVLGCRVLLQVVGGGSPQLWVASVGVAAAVAWFVLATRVLGQELLRGYALGLALAATSHAFLGTWGAVWRSDGWAWSLLAVQVVLVAVGAGASPSRPASRALAVAILPSYLLAGIWAANPARGSSVEETWGPVVVVAAAVVAVGVARVRLGRVGTAVAGVLLCGSTGLVLLPSSGGAVALLAFAVGMPTLVLVLAGLAGPAARGMGEADPRVVGAPVADPRAAGASVRPAGRAAGGALLWVVLFFAYYAGYDLGYRADLVVVGIAAVLAVAALLRADASSVSGPVTRDVRVPAAALVPVALLALAGPAVTMSTVEAPRDEHEGLRVMAWNLRMGYGMDGSFEIEEVAELIREQDPDVVLLSEIDRAWLLNGGQDQLAILARLLGMDAYFGPAADPVWGDAVLTSLPVRDVESHALPSYDAVTGAQALSLSVAHAGTMYDVVSTHVQPHGGAGDGALDQARDIAELAADLAADGSPVVVGGDFNLQPGDPSWRALVDAGLVDALAEARPLPTSPADAPEEQIDHVFTTPGLVATEPRAIRTEHSDHLPVVVTVAVDE